MNKLDVIGRGLLGSAFLSDCYTGPEAIFFASGVSNSGCVDLDQFSREQKTLTHAIQNFPSRKIFIYFSTCSICDVSSLGVSPYVVHKVNMENLVRQRSSYLIVRLPQVVGFTNNRNTLLNFLRDSLVERRRISIQRDAVRNIIDVDDVVKLVFSILNSGEYFNTTVDVVNLKSIKVSHLLSVLEDVLQIPAIYEIIDGGSAYPVDASVVTRFVDSVNVNFDDGYVKRVICKYFK